MKFISALALSAALMSGAAYAMSGTATGVSSTDVYSAKECKEGYYWSSMKNKCVKKRRGSY